MNFFDNILEELGLIKSGVAPTFRAMLIGENLAYFESVRSIKSFTPTKIILTIKSGEIIIEGENMFFKKYDLGDLVVCGKINSLKRA